MRLKQLLYVVLAVRSAAVIEPGAAQQSSSSLMDSAQTITYNPTPDLTCSCGAPGTVYP